MHACLGMQRSGEQSRGFEHAGAAGAGLIRDVPPTALLLRGGDAVVMTGQARRSFHGVPRVLPGEPLTEAQVALLPEQHRPFAEHIQNSGLRINISIRCAS